MCVCVCRRDMFLYKLLQMDKMYIYIQTCSTNKVGIGIGIGIGAALWPRH